MKQNYIHSRPLSFVQKPKYNDKLERKSKMKNGEATTATPIIDIERDQYTSFIDRSITLNCKAEEKMLCGDLIVMAGKLAL